MTALAHLLALRALLEPAGAWLPGNAFGAVDGRGHPCSAIEASARRWGLFAAMRSVGGGDAVQTEVTAHLRRAVGAEWVPGWEEQPGRTRDDVIRALDRAIALARDGARP